VDGGERQDAAGKGRAQRDAGLEGTERSISGPPSLPRWALSAIWRTIRKGQERAVGQKWQMQACGG
jgi:hypothetical protein